jgi:uncharacterized protein YggE
MKLSLAGVVVLALGAVAMAGCSGGTEPATPTGAGSTNLAGIVTRGLGTVTKTPDTVTVVIGVKPGRRARRVPLTRTQARRPH